MKKFFLRIVAGIVVLLVLGVLAIILFLDGTIKRGVETVGPKITGVAIKLDSVSLSLLSGSGGIKGLVVGNPDGFKTPQAISVGSASLTLKPGSIFSDKIVIRSIHVEAPEITFESGLGGNNLGKILSNVQSGSGADGKTDAAGKQEKPARKLEVDDFAILGARVNVSLAGLGGKSVVVALPDIHLTDLGTGPDGITAAELTKRILTEIERGAAKAAAGSFGDLNKAANAVTKDLGKTAGATTSNLTRSLGDLLKKK